MSYLYGIVYPVGEIAGFCAERGILLVEDAAESYYGNGYSGSSRAVMTLFSFGSIKRYTSFGGALAFIRDSEIYEKMVSVHTSLKVQTRREFCKKLIRSFGIGVLLNSTKANYILRKLSHTFNFDHKEFGVRNLRGFAPANDFLEKFNKRPSVSLVAFLYERLKKFDPVTFKATNKKINVLPNNIIGCEEQAGGERSASPRIQSGRAILLALPSAGPRCKAVLPPAQQAWSGCVLGSNSAQKDSSR